MSLADYTSLKASIADWLRRPGDITAGSSIVDDWIDMAEAEFGNTLRVRSMEATTDSAMTAGYLIHPSDWIAWKRLSLIDSGRLVDLTPAPNEFLDIVGDGTTGQPNIYAVKGSKTYFNRVTNYTIRCWYYQQIPALSATTTTNWLLTKYPQLYLYGSLLQATGYVVDDGRLPVWKQAYDEVFQKLITDSVKSTRGGQAPFARIPNAR